MSSSSNEPGSANYENESTKQIAKQALAQKRNVRDLNTRLEMYVRAQAEKTRNVTQLKEALARQEMELKNKLKQQQLQFQDNIEKLRKENENLAYDNKCTHSELTNINSQKKEFESRLIASESKNATLTSELSAIRLNENRLKEELETSRKECATLNYKYDSYSAERNSFSDRMNKQKIKNEQLLRELTQIETSLKSEKETFSRVLIEKESEIDELKGEISELLVCNNDTQSRLRSEFDNKLADFVSKREDQYKQEKDEWMRIFKEEFNRKLRSFKEANQELSHCNIKQSEENVELRGRISKLKSQKTELEVLNRNLEEENEKLRNDLDDLRRQKDLEIKHKNTQILQSKDKYKAKELQFEELAGIKLQLDAEIELYRNILNDAEKECGYSSPFRQQENNCTNNVRNSRKRKRLNTYGHMTPMGASSIDNNNNLEKKIILCENSNNSHSNSKIRVITPGIARGGMQAVKDIKELNIESGSDNDNDTEMKDTEESSDDCFDTCDEDNYGTVTSTPIGIEGGQLQFSGLDLNKGMIEIQNMGELDIKLNGYSLCNKSGEQQYDLPKDMILECKQKLRIYVGEKIYKQICNSNKSNDMEKLGEKFVGKNYDGAYVFWGCDVWEGSNKDCARLYNPKEEEVARIEISPDMIDKNNSKGGCYIM